MFPTANSTIIRNEDGEPMGFETTAYDEPEYNPDDYLAYDEEPDVWDDPDACEAEGHHGVSLNRTNEGTWECSACGTEVEHTDPWESLLNED
jgi:hypothetical protein